MWPGEPKEFQYQVKLYSRREVFLHQCWDNWHWEEGKDLALAWQPTSPMETKQQETTQLDPPWHHLKQS
jgi:hypothetical protein